LGVYCLSMCIGRCHGLYFTFFERRTKCRELLLNWFVLVGYVPGSARNQGAKLLGSGEAGTYCGRARNVANGANQDKIDILNQAAPLPSWKYDAVDKSVFPSVSIRIQLQKLYDGPANLKQTRKKRIQTSAQTIAIILQYIEYE